jgi:hypothetical protein
LDQRQRAVVGATIGSVSEGYDWIVYGTFSATILPTLFFPASDAALATLASMASNEK